METTRDVKMLARLLISYEATAFHTPESMESIVVRVYEKLQISLGAFAGAAGFRSLAARALALARSEAPDLAALTIALDGSLCGFEDKQRLSISEQKNSNGTAEYPVKRDPANEDGIILIAQILGLLFIFLGDALTLSLLRDAWPVAAFDEHGSGHGRTQ